MESYVLNIGRHGKMNKEEIHKLEMQHPVFKIQQRVKDGLIEYVVEANSGGLYKYAEQLTELANQAEQDVHSTELYLDKEDWISGDVVLNRVEIIRHDQAKEYFKHLPKTLVQDGLLKLGCVLTIIATIALLIIGLVTTIRWLF